ncbi:RluA family pseudouridine synthase [Streptococcaceae bacterium ESL0687]|nr:RluA family pseudouridine synthase [Streptococcaceae bacterium ESL0687]
MKYNITIPQNSSNMTLNMLLEEKWLLPRKQRHLLRTKKGVLINNENKSWETIVGPGDLISLNFDPSDYPQKQVTFGDKNLIDCLYEDEHLIIVNKPEGMKTHPNEPQEIALLNHVSAYLGHSAYVVHRLDQETSGAILFAKNQFVLPLLGKMLEEKKIYRTYLALSQGKIAGESFTIDKPLGRDRHNSKKRVVSKSGKRAVTHIQLLDRLNRTSYVSCQLETGRTHQIRVHLASINHPIVGDPLYGKIKEKRMMLHASKLSLIHPFTGENLEFHASSSTFNSIINKYS